MKNLRTSVSVSSSSSPIDLDSKVLTLGSCFAQAIGGQLHQCKFKCLPNPFGTIYNPLSIDKILRYSLLLQAPPQNTYALRDDIYVNYDFHSEFSDPDEGRLKERISNGIETTHHFLKDAQWLLITYGTSHVYKQKNSGEIVANCHKMPSAFFMKSLLSEKEIIESFQEMHKLLSGFNPHLKIILTVSPVRHIKDSLELNSVSKAILRIACHQLAEKFSNVEYFPAYEIMLDDLRDYRFYKSDLLHPTEDAEEYIWEKFSDRYFREETKNFLKAWKNISAALSHKPFHPQSHAHQNFLRTILKKLEALQDKAEVQEEIRFVREQLL